MGQSRIFSYISRGIVLLLVDIITLLLIFPVWTLFRFALFPWALAFIALTLIFLNVSVMGISALANRPEKVMAGPLILTTSIYYVLMLAFTGITYYFIPVHVYVIWSLILLALYLSAVLSLCWLARRLSGDESRQEREKSESISIRQLTLDLGDTLQRCKQSLSEEEYQQIQSAYDSAIERLEASTPFGRLDGEEIVRIERSIYACLTSINEKLLCLTQAQKQASDITGVVASFMEVKRMVMNKEKMIRQ